MNTAVVHHEPHPSRLPALSLLVAGAATVLSVVALSVAADDDVGSVVPRSAPADVAVRDPATIIQSEIDKALTEHRAEFDTPTIAASDVTPMYDAKDSPRYASAVTETEAFPPHGSVWRTWTEEPTPPSRGVSTVFRS